MIGAFFIEDFASLERLIASLMAISMLQGWQRRISLLTTRSWYRRFTAAKVGGLKRRLKYSALFAVTQLMPGVTPCKRARWHSP